MKEMVTDCITIRWSNLVKQPNNNRVGGISDPHLFTIINK